MEMKPSEIQGAVWKVGFLEKAIISYQEPFHGPETQANKSQLIDYGWKGACPFQQNTTCFKILEDKNMGHG